MKRFEYSQEKEEWLKQVRDISFEDILAKIEKKEILANRPHPNKKRYPGQKIFILVWKNYVYIVPYVETKEKIFLKTIYLSRRFTKQYLKGGNDEKKEL